ncbi:PCMD domain-containing protein [Eudoraea chungangensis]|uniref:PCMD domain-containing protein n=1 Tax=Eudoraea chungangensis TaxID=1481905 RepID=UPI0023ED3BDD|nr:PCMD domain-containing protein [Eudoraea chungangensis]
MNKYKWIVSLTLLLVFSCISEDYFGLSNIGNIKSIEVSNQAQTAVINTDSLSVKVQIPNGVDLSNITIEKLEISSFASSDKDVGDLLNLNNPQTIELIAEDGSNYLWEIEAFIASDNPQLDNYDLNLWYETSTNYFEPGADASSTIWGTGNPGTQILNKLATTPTDLGDNNLAAKMETLDNGPIAGAFGAPISSGSIFTGVFNSDNIDPSNPQAAIEFGTPFAGRPQSFKVKYSYNPGAENKDKDGNVLGFPDACDIYALLEIRSGGQVERLATAWFRSSSSQTDLATLEIPFTYGPLDESFPDYTFPTDHGFVSRDSANFVLPTHITFVGASSFGGANFSGAIGSVLVIDDVEMVYE